MYDVNGSARIPWWWWRRLDWMRRCLRADTSVFIWRRILLVRASDYLYYWYLDFCDCHPPTHVQCTMYYLSGRARRPLYYLRIYICTSMIILTPFLPNFFAKCIFYMYYEAAKKVGSILGAFTPTKKAFFLIPGSSSSFTKIAVCAGPHFWATPPL